MHSTIAGLASGVATAAIAYSYKTRGVFETCGMRDHVVDAREVDTQDAVDRLFELYQRRKTTKVALLGCRDELIARAETQMDEIVEAAGARMLERA
jgi:polysaccharide pyruvyl transferase WcaK-like protein